MNGPACGLCGLPLRPDLAGASFAPPAGRCCWLAVNDPDRLARLLARLGRPPAEPIALEVGRGVGPHHAQPPADCGELGPPLPGQEAVWCGAKARRCGLHGRCSTLAEVRLDGVTLPCCWTCPDHTGRQ